MNEPRTFHYRAQSKIKRKVELRNTKKDEERGREREREIFLILYIYLLNNYSRIFEIVFDNDISSKVIE